MTPPISMRELVERATPGPWKAGSRRGYNRNTIYAQNGENEHADEGVAQVYGIPINHHTDEPLEERWAEGDANAQLIARLSPSVVLAVMDALEDFKAACESAPPLELIARIGIAKEKADKALALLDGKNTEI